MAEKILIPEQGVLQVEVETNIDTETLQLEYSIYNDSTGEKVVNNISDGAPAGESIFFEFSYELEIGQKYRPEIIADPGGLSSGLYPIGDVHDVIIPVDYLGMN